MDRARLALAAALLLQLTYLQAQDPFDVPGTRVSPLARVFTAGDCADGTGKSSVCSSCTAVDVCVAGASIGSATCGTATPYCNEGEVEATCSTTPSSDCGGAAAGQPATITCASLGLLPDPVNCRYYHLCLSVGTAVQSAVYECPPGYAFSVAVLACRSTLYQSCVSVTCNASNAFVYYGSTQRYYAYCAAAATAGAAPTPHIFKCPNRAVFNMNTRSCVYTCFGQGNFVNTNDLNTYYQCYLSNGRMVSQLRRCPVGPSGATTFNQTLGYCT
ncbi:hypothetical protein pipiens_011914 [Culex pipiens pipiens]|uniref:Chitin-binding type-2 domain-containing protein n=1 Tax=Culex pipiens pipiens TaxID=38569 RepID=A0ABD1D4V4_CULPP|nr:uncharacterized protein LOC120417257 [Culex pipiens pallens]